MILRKYENNPVLSPFEQNTWENLVVCNPGVWHENGTFYMLYRAAGDDTDHVIRFGLATSKDGYHFERVSDKPVFGPSLEGPDSGCVEDPRIVKYDNEYYITYAFRPYPPGQYWKFGFDEVRTPDTGSCAPRFLKENLANSGLALTRDFLTWQRLGRITLADTDDRDVILFPEKINGRFAMLHRPKEWTGKEWGPTHPAIWIRFSDDLLVWTEPSHLLIEGKAGTWEEKVGGSTPPVKTDRGWLVIYHGVENGGKGYYRVGAALLDPDDPSIVLGRTANWIMEPEFDYELEGFYKGCVFPTGNVLLGDTLYLYYGAADKYVGMATANIHELTDEILKNK